jgi:hypothetical protein
MSRDPLVWIPLFQTKCIKRRDWDNSTDYHFWFRGMEVLDKAGFTDYAGWEEWDACRRGEESAWRTG